MSKLKKGNVLCIGDLHIPFELDNYLEFVKEIQWRCKCEKVVMIGDLCDNNAISYHEHDPDGWSPADEMDEADRHLAIWFKAFPKLIITKGNHDTLVDRKGKTIGLPKRCFLPFRKVWRLPKTWKDVFEVDIDGVRYIHGTKRSGKFPHVLLAQQSMRSAVMGHCHTVGGVNWLNTGNKPIFGMCVGAGLDYEKYAFAYGTWNGRQPMIGCGVVTDHGKQAQFFPMST